MPVPPESVTVTWVQVPEDSAAGALMRCSAPAPPVVVAKRAVPELLRGVKNMLAAVPDPKSNTRDQVVTVSGRTQADTVKPVAPLRIPAGSETYCEEPLSETPLPSRPATKAAPP